MAIVFDIGMGAVEKFLRRRFFRSKN